YEHALRHQCAPLQVWYSGNGTAVNLAARLTGPRGPPSRGRSPAIIASRVPARAWESPVSTASPGPTGPGFELVALRWPLVAVATVLGVGVGGYMLIEGWDFF